MRDGEGQGIEGGMTRFCNHHLGYAESGEYRKTANGKSRRWVCSDCAARIKTGQGKSYNPEVVAKEQKERVGA